MPRFLTLDAALASCSAGVVEAGCVLAMRSDDSSQAVLLPVLAQRVLEAGGGIDTVAVTVGPGSFTGLRAALALAHGIGLAAGVPVVGVTVGAAMSYLAPAGRQLWAAVNSRRGRMFSSEAGR